MIWQKNQYNQGMSRYKLLSTTAGVGCVITTKFGYSILVSEILEWDFISRAHKKIQMIISNEADKEKWYSIIKRDLENNIGILTIDDIRFVDFLRTNKKLVNLLCLVQIPQLALTEYNTINSNNPIIARVESFGNKANNYDYVVPATHFPKWFKNKKGELKKYEEWKSLWIKSGNDLQYFVPPRDARHPILGVNKEPIKRKIKDNKEIVQYEVLNQINLMLICPNGHLSDIPWSKYLRWASERDRNEKIRGYGLFQTQECCSKPDLLWTESTLKSEGYASIFIECRNCKSGSGVNGNRKISLEGITNITPRCSGEKPWEMHLSDPKDIAIPKEECKRDALDPQDQDSMRVALVTANNIYFANTFTSIFVPIQVVKNISNELSEALKKQESKYKTYQSFESTVTRSQFAEKYLTYDKLKNDYQAELQDEQGFIEKLRELFLDESSNDEEVVDYSENYRYQEYKAFMDNKDVTVEDLSFSEIELSSELKNKFSKISSIDELKLSSIQYDFSRVRPIEGKLDAVGNWTKSEGMKLFSSQKNEILCLPCNTYGGEGVFIGINEASLGSWYKNKKPVLDERLNKITDHAEINDQASELRYEIRKNGIKYLLIHSLAHIIMRELEFSCGYPTASLHERLYISQRMNGLLIYTAEGSEGSMGGLVSQVTTENLQQLIKTALLRSMDCSSDPLCWETTEQGMLDMNLAACFSCLFISETSCEQRNLALDRQILINPDFGFFRDWIY